MHIHELQMGELVVGGKGEHLITSGVGSCVVITLYDPHTHIGGMAHAMLPGTGNGATSPLKARYVERAIDTMIEQMEQLGARRAHIEAKLVGGANMFPRVDVEISEGILENAKDKLEREHIQLVGESVGGSVGRSVEFAVDSGIVTISIKF